MSLKEVLSLRNKKGNLGSAMSSKANSLIGVLVGVVVIAILLAAFTPIIFESVNNFTTALVAGDTSGIAAAFVIVIGIVVTLFLIGILFIALRTQRR